MVSHHFAEYLAREVPLEVPDQRVVEPHWPGVSGSFEPVALEVGSFLIAVRATAVVNWLQRSQDLAQADLQVLPYGCEPSLNSFLMI